MSLGHEVAKIGGRLIMPIRAGTKKLASERDVASGGNVAVSSSAFAPDQPIPDRFAGEQAPSPPIAWSGVPKGTRELAILCEDPDAPFPKPYVHWVLYGISPDTSFLPEGAKAAVAGKNSTGKMGFTGPKPPPGHGVHHYHFQVFALDAPSNLPAGADREALLRAMNGHVLDWGEAIGTYEVK